MKRDVALNDLLALFWIDYKFYKTKYKDQALITENSVPLVWHGDVNRYFSSNGLSVVTASINPSSSAFLPEKGQFKEEDLLFFKELQTKETLDDLLSDKYQSILNRYFINYQDANKDRIFRKYERMLNVFGSSYFSHSKPLYSQALHVDMYTAISTQKLWSQFEKTHKEISLEMKQSGLVLFKRLYDCLKPDLLLISASKDAIKTVFEVNSEFKLIKSYMKKNALKDSLAANLYKNEQNQYILFGYNNFIGPFSRISEDEIKDILDDVFYLIRK